MPILGSGGIGHASGCALLEGSTAYVGFDECKEPYANYFLCDGTADDVQIQQAIDYVNSLGGGEVYIEDGTYTISATVTLYDDISFIGSGRETILVAINALDTDLITATARTGILIKHIKIDGNQANQGGVAVSMGIVFNGCSDSTVSNCWFTQVHDQCVFVGGSSDILISENYFDEIRHRGIDLDHYGGNQCFRVIVAHNTIQMKTAGLTAGACGIKYEEVRESIIAENTIRGSGQGSGQDEEGIVIQSKPGPVVDVSEDLIVVGNLVKGSDSTCISVSDVENVIISSNEVLSGSSYGISVRGTSHNCVISANKVRDMTQRGIFVEDSDFISISGNSSSLNAGDNIYLNECDHCSMSGNTTIESTGGHGFSIDTCTFLTITAHVSEGNNGRGAYIYSNSLQINLQGVIEGNGQQGILITDSTYITVHDSIIANNTNQGIVESGTSDYNWFYKNDLSGNSAPAVIIGQNTKLTTKTFPFIAGGDVEGTAIWASFVSATASAKGWSITGADDWAAALSQLPLELQQIVRFKIWAVALGAPIGGGGQMHLEIVMNAGADDLAFTTEAVALANFDGATTDYVNTDVIHWVVDSGDDADIGSMVGGMSLEVKVIYETGDDPDGATNAIFRAVEVEYV